MQINVKKTYLMLIDNDKKRREQEPAPRLTINGETLQVMNLNDACRYLGYWGTGNGDMRVSASSSLLQILRNSSRRHSVLMLLSLSSVTNFAFWLLCSVHAIIQVPPDGVVGSRNCCCHSFAACTVDVTVCFIRQTVNALTSGLSRYSAQPTPC